MILKKVNLNRKNKIIFLNTSLNFKQVFNKNIIFVVNLLNNYQ